MYEEVLKAVPHRHLTFSTPKILRRYFLYDRRLLSDLSRCGWEALKAYYTNGVRDSKTVPGGVVAIQIFEDFPLGFHPHLHILASDGCFHENGMFSVFSGVDTKTLEQIFRHKVLKMLLSKGKITQDMIALLDKWRHSGFNVYCGPRIQQGDVEAMKNLAHYIVRASFSQERMTYFQEDSKIVYRSKDGKEEKIFDALECLAAMCSHVPNKGEQIVRYYGYYSNVNRGKRKMQDGDKLIPSILEPDESSKESRKNWARLIQKIYEIDPLTCPKCSGPLRVISVIKNEQVIAKILNHLGLLEVKAQPPPKTSAPQPNVRIDTSDSQVPPRDDYLFHDPEYPIEAHI